MDRLLDINNRRVLIVDDTPQNLDVLGKTLRPQGYNLAIANSGEQAIKTAQHFKPELILLDVMMPGMDGYETCSRLKTIDELKDVPVIFVTAKHEPEDIVHGFKVGGVDYINKPFVQEEVCVRVELHLELYAAKKKLIKMNQQKNRFLGIAAHDLKNPLTAIMGFSELTLEDISDNSVNMEKFEKRISMIFSASTTMYQLINDLLDISVIEEGALSISKSSSLISLLLTERVNIARVQSSKKDINIELNCDDSIEVWLDINRINQVVDNLLSNAIKFSPAGSSIRVSVEHEPEYIQVSVIDNGPGIPEDERQTLFEEFETLSTRPTAGEKSTGLGMSIVKKLVEAHGGEVFVENTTGGGATISFTLPDKE